MSKLYIFLVIKHSSSKSFSQYLAMGVTANCICEIHCIALDGFDLSTVHKLSSKEKKSQLSWASNQGLLGRKQ